MATYAARLPMTVSVAGGPTLDVAEWTLDGPPVMYLRSEDAVKPDPKWSAADSRGHVHRWVEDELPTLAKSWEHVECDGSCGGVCEGEGYDITVWHCVACGDRVEPGYVPDYAARTTGTPVETGPATATLVLEQDPRPEHLRDAARPEAFDVTLHLEGRRADGRGGVTNRERQLWSGSRATTRFTVEVGLTSEWLADQAFVTE